MKKTKKLFLILMFSTQTVAICAQLPEKLTPQFTLTVSEYRQDQAPGAYRVRILATNTSNEDLHLDGCAPRRGLYSLSVAYDGVPIAEKDAAARHQREDRMRHTVCTSSSINDLIKPGKAHEDILGVTGEYDMSRPGTYEITVSRETLPDDPMKSVTVKSNTIIIVVPDPPADEPK
jgi:hypothetical protein